MKSQIDAVIFAENDLPLNFFGTKIRSTSDKKSIFISKNKNKSNFNAENATITALLASLMKISWIFVLKMLSLWR